VTDLNPRKLALARSYGATHTYQMSHDRARTMDAIADDFPDGVEVVVPCLLAGEGMIDAIDCAAMTGRIIMYGCIGTCSEPFDFLKVHRKRLTISSTEPCSDRAMRRYWDEGLNLVEQGLVDLAGMITHTFPLDRISEAFELRNDQSADAMHILIDCRKDEES
jgi:L-iditol 2-dehydrogenase